MHALVKCIRSLFSDVRLLLCKKRRADFRVKMCMTALESRFCGRFVRAITLPLKSGLMSTRVQISCRGARDVLVSVWKVACPTTGACLSSTADTVNQSTAWAPNRQFFKVIMVCSTRDYWACVLRPSSKIIRIWLPLTHSLTHSLTSGCFTPQSLCRQRNSPQYPSRRCCGEHFIFPCRESISAFFPAA
jgi:hypothetical protein